ncbi:MAG TPA: HD domain-containing phosphohydrolase [Devosia sp.]|nr:HD domain-containing phosphohydrolase [Devosia sp.]
MQATSTIRLSELLGALSTALDMTEGQPIGHCMRTCWIGTNIGLRLGLEGGRLHDLYYALLLKDLGCTSNAARICELFLADDIAFKKDLLATDDASMPQAVQFLLTHTAVGADLSERLKALFRVAANKKTINRDLIDARCTRGADIARQMRFNDEVAKGILHLDERWDGSGNPHGLRGDEIPLNAQVALLSQVIDVFATAQGPNAAVAEVQRRAGRWFNPELVEMFLEVAQWPRFWEVWGSSNLEAELFSLEPALVSAPVDDGYLDDITTAFASIIDSKSPYTSGHSERVTMFADLIAGELGTSEPRRRWLRRAALLHDIGKLGVSSRILDKPGKLDDTEWTSIRMHPVYTEEVLSRVAAFRELTPIAAAHHERLDGAGYPYRLSGPQILKETRIITTADIFDALTADRPYRPAMPVEKALKLMADMCGTAIDPDCFTALCSGIGASESIMRSIRKQRVAA